MTLVLIVAMWSRVQILGIRLVRLHILIIHSAGGEKITFDVESRDQKNVAGRKTDSVHLSVKK